MPKAGKTAKSKPTLGTIVAQKMRTEANKLTDEQRDESMAAAMEIIYGKSKTAPHAVRR